MASCDRHAFIVIACVILAACGGAGGSPGLSPVFSPSPAPEDRQAVIARRRHPASATTRIDQVVAQNYSGGWGVELAIFKNGKPVYVHGYGLRDRGLPDSFGGYDFWGVEQPDKIFNLTRGQFAAGPDDDLRFGVGQQRVHGWSDSTSSARRKALGKRSARKIFSKLSERQRKSRCSSCCSIAAAWLTITRSGSIPTSVVRIARSWPRGQTNYQPIVHRLATFPLKFIPGTQYDYSNSNYLLLGMIAAMVSGEPLRAFLQQRIFGPVGMTQTNQGFPAPPISDIALGYADYGIGPQRTYQPNLAWLAGPGGLTSTVGDLDKWDRAVMHPGIFTQASLTQMFSPSPFPQSYGTYADGWFISTLGGHSYIWHDGDITGYQTMNAIFPNDGTEIVILTNDGSGLDPYYIVPQLFSIALTM